MSRFSPNRRRGSNLKLESQAKTPKYRFQKWDSLPMKRVLFATLLFMLVISIAPIMTRQGSGIQTVHAQSGPEIIAQVTDQNGLFYNGVQVQVWQQSGSLLYSGVTQNGFFASGDLSATTNYLVIVNSGYQSENQTVFVGSTNTLVKFVLTRPPAPILSVNAVNFTPNIISPGSIFVAAITVQSSSLGAAYYSSISFNASNPTGISVSGTGSIFNLGTISGNSSENINVTFRVQDTASTGTYSIPYVLTFRNSSSAQFTSVGFMTVPVAGVPSRPVLIISDVSINPNLITPGSNFITSINVTNTGTQSAYAATIGVTIPSQTITLIGTTGQYNMGVLAANESRIVRFPMSSPFSAQAGIVLVDFTLAYNNKLGTVFNSSGTFSISLSSTPNLQVQSFSLSSSPLVAGGTSDMTINVINVGGDTAYSVSLSVVGIQFLSGNSSNYLGAILSQGTGKAIFVLNVANNTLPGSYNFTLAMRYDDIEGVSYSSLNNYSLTVAPYSSPSISITNILVNPPVLSTGISGSITLFFKNFGSVIANNVTVQVTGGGSIVSSNYFGLGTIASGGQITQIIGVNVDPKATAGDHTLIFNVTYTDSNGKVYHSSVPMTITIYTSPNLFSTKNIIIVAGVIIAALFSGLLLLRWRKAGYF